MFVPVTFVLYFSRRIAFSQADAEGRAMYLGSSNIANTFFYESHGFVEVASFLLGEDNPTWKEPPVKMLVVSQSVGLEKINSFINRYFLDAT